MSVKFYWDSIVRDCVSYNVVIVLERNKKKLRKSTFLNIIRIVLDQLHNFRQDDMSVQDYIAKFEDLTLHYDLREHILIL